MGDVDPEKVMATLLEQEECTGIGGWGSKFMVDIENSSRNIKVVVMMILYDSIEILVGHS